MSTIEQIRQYRIGPYAIFDLVVSFIGVYLLSPLLNKIFLKTKITTTKLTWILLALPLSIAIHLFFGQQTQMVKDFMSPSDNYFLKVTILFLTYLGIKSIKGINS